MCFSRYNLAKQLGIATLSCEKNGLTLEPSLKYDVEKKQTHPVLAVSQKKGADTLRLAYDIDAEAATLEWVRKPYKVCKHILTYVLTWVCGVSWQRMSAHHTTWREQEQVHILVSTIGSALPLHVDAGDPFKSNQYWSKCLMMKSTWF